MVPSTAPGVARGPAAGLGPRGLIALWLGKLVMWLSRASGRGGTSLPGRVSGLLAPGILGALARQCRRGCILVTGTNGKTTTASMVVAMLRESGYRVVHNRSGANLLRGLAAAFIEVATPGGRVDADYGVLEVDEATVPGAVAELPVVGAVVTNFFRDQLDRYGELDRTVALVGEGLARLPVAGFAVLNADDPLVAGLASGLRARVIRYGIEDLEAGTTLSHQTREARHCGGCGTALAYELFYYAHLGRYSCPSCGAGRPVPHVSAARVAPQGSRGADIRLGLPAGPLSLRLPVPGLYNVYNAVAAAACGTALGLEPAAIGRALEGYASRFGRMETVRVDGRGLLMALVKNPAGFNEVIRTVLGDGAVEGLVIAINDRLADGTDVSWLWDVDFEQLAHPPGRIAWVVCSGTRAHDMAVRLKYAGFDPARLALQTDLWLAINEGLGRLGDGGVLTVLPTYTAMLELRDLLARRGLAARFWQTG